MSLVLRKGIRVSLTWSLVVGVIAFCVTPFLWALLSAFKTGSALFDPSLNIRMMGNAGGYALSLDNFRDILSDRPFLTSLRNSLFVAGTTTFLCLLLSLPAAYSLSRYRFRGRILVLMTILCVSMFPQIAILSGLFELIRYLGLYNQLSGLAFSYMVLVLPFTVWVLRGFLKSIPTELEEAAVMDGCSPWQILTRVFLPLAKPAIATTGLLAFIAAWNEFLFALTLTLSADKRTVPVAIAMLSGASQYELPWGNLMAASIVVTVPLLFLVLIFQRHIVSGLTSGAVKG